MIPDPRPVQTQDEIEAYWAKVRERLRNEPLFQITRTKETILSEIAVYEQRLAQLKQELKTLNQGDNL